MCISSTANARGFVISVETARFARVREPVCPGDVAVVLGRGLGNASAARVREVNVVETELGAGIIERNKK